MKFAQKLEEKNLFIKELLKTSFSRQNPVNKFSKNLEYLYKRNF